MATPTFLLVTVFLMVLWPVTYAANFVGESEYAVKILKNNDNKNVIFSPLSINTAFGMLYVGAQGESKAQLKRAMFNHMTDDQLLSKVANLSDVFNARSERCNITLANRAWAKDDFPLLAAYTNTIRTKFSSDIVPVAEFGPSTVREINGWVEEKTSGKIKDILKPDDVSPVTRLVLANALHFKAEFTRKLGDAWDKEFHTAPREQITVKMMRNDKVSYPYYENADVQVLGLDFVRDSAGPQLKMFVFLPKQRFGLKEFESKSTNLEQLLALAKQTAPTNMRKVEIPKFKIDFDLDLKGVLQSAGIRDVFDDKKADLSKINNEKTLYVSKAVHKATIEVAERGVEAAAATVVIFMNGTASMVTDTNQYVTDFVAEHPFLFIIADTRDYTPLFLGKFVGN